MKPLARLMLLVALVMPVLSGCGLAVQAGPVSFDSLARRVPRHVSQTFFLDLKPAGEAGTYWQQFRNRLRANLAAEQAVDTLLAQFHMQDLGLDSFIVGPAVSGYFDNGTQYIILQVNSLSAARDALLLQDPGNLDWEQEDYQGTPLYHRRVRFVYGQPQWRAFAAYDDLMFVTTSSNGDPIEDLRTLVGLPVEQSLASYPAWKTLEAQLPDHPMGLIFLNLGSALQQSQPPSGDESPATALGQQIEALAFSAMPERDGIRVEIAGTFHTQGDVAPLIRQLLQLPGVDPGSWDSLPANTAMAISTHDAATIWPVLGDIFPTQGLDMIRDTLGLDIEADLFGSDGPFSGDLALAITPPLPDQPISQGLPAGQLLLLTRGTSQAQMAAIREAMEDRGAILGSRTADGIELQVQAGTELAGYAISFGFDDEVFVLGTSPATVEQSVSARHEGNGLVADPIFQQVLDKMPQDPTFFAYLNTPSLIDLEKGNMTAQQYEQSVEMASLEVFDAIGLGLNLTEDGIRGTIQFFLREG